MDINLLASTIEKLVIQGRGILAADESTNTIRKRLDSIHVESTEENRRFYRNMLFTTPNLGDYISGTILFEETLNQKADDGTTFPALLSKQGIVPGIKVDKGLIELPNSSEEKMTQGLDGLSDRLKAYKELGALFAKWRVVFHISDVYPSCLAVRTNAELLAKYAAICQNADIVPIVEPEVLMDGDHDLAKCAEVSERVFHQVFHRLHKNKVLLEYMLLKPNMIVAGKDCAAQPGVAEMAEETVKVLRRTVPAAVPSINFLSGGLSAEISTALLNAINQLGPHPWYVSFSYGRALQGPALKAWGGMAANLKAAQDALFKRAKLNGAAAKGGYNESME